MPLTIRSRPHVENISDTQFTAQQARMLLASLLLASVSLCLGEIPNHDEALADRLVLLEKKMMGLEEENKYLRLVCSDRPVCLLPSAFFSEPSQ